MLNNYFFSSENYTSFIDYTLQVNFTYSYTYASTSITTTSIVMKNNAQERADSRRISKVGQSKVQGKYISYTMISEVDFY